MCPYLLRKKCTTGINWADIIILPARKLPEGEVTLKDEADGISIVCGCLRITLIGLPDEKFSKLPSFHKSVGFKMEQKLLEQMINQTIFAVAKTSRRRKRTWGVH